jgi:hypothetical protein
MKELHLPKISFHVIMLRRASPILVRAKSPHWLKLSNPFRNAATLDGWFVLGKKKKKKKKKNKIFRQFSENVFVDAFCVGGRETPMLMPSPNAFLVVC